MRQVIATLVLVAGLLLCGVAVAEDGGGDNWAPPGEAPCPVWMCPMDEGGGDNRAPTGAALCPVSGCQMEDGGGED
jgi:hypothetical protein